MKLYTLYCGLFDKETKRQEISTLEAYKITSNIVTELCGGGTIFEAAGVYRHENGDIVQERTLRIEVCNVDSETIKKLIEILKMAFNQESIMVTVQELTYEFV